MKKILRIPLLFVALLLSSIPISAHDFEVDGIYYNITSSTDKTVAVSYQGYSYDSYSNEYTGSVVIPEAVTYSGATYSVTSIGDYAFYKCNDLTSVAIPNSVISIGGRAFFSCKGLTSVAVPNSVISIGTHAFLGCSDGLEVYITDLSAWCRINMENNTSNPLNNASKLVLNGSEVIDLVIPSDITEIKDYTFSGCSSLTSVTIGNSVTTIGYFAFSSCSGLTSVTIGNSVTTIGDAAFWYCFSLTDITIGNSVTSIEPMAFADTPWYNNQPDGVVYINNILYSYKGIMPESTSIDIKDGTVSITRSAFYGCTGLTSVTIPNSVSTIGSQAFYNCSNLASLSGGENLSSISNDAFWGCNKLIDGSVAATTQTTATIRLTSPTQYKLGAYYSDNDKAQAVNGVAKLTGLKPGSTISSYDLALIINGIYCPIKDLSFTTQSFSAYLSGSATTTSVSAIGTYTDGDVTILGEGINYGSSVTNYDGNNTITVNNLDPNTSYTIYYAVKIQEGGVYTASKSFTTGALTWSNGGFTATSTSSARLSVETNCDATAGTGFEWKRYDAPESLAPSKAPCPIVDGMLIGSLRNLNPDVYYKCRPYYTSSSGTTYYGEWITFFTGDANVYFEPEVRTFSERSIVNNSVTVKGYALPGTDDISEQGFEYWKVPASRATSTVMTVKASGISMTATLADLEYNSTYRYRAYVKTAQGTFYGAEEEFSTGEDPAGIGYIEVDSNNFDVMLRENPATATAWIKVAGTSAIEAEYYILTTNGGMVAKGFIPADGEYQPIELNIAPGLYLMSVTDGSHRKTLRLIVR